MAAPTWNGQLTAGCIRDIMSGVKPKCFMQVLNIKKLASQGGNGTEKYRMVMSDGVEQQLALLNTQLNHLAVNGNIQQNTILYVEESTSSTTQDRVIIILINVQVIASVHDKIGNPKPLYDQKGGSDAPAPVAAPAPHAAPTPAYQPVSSYGGHSAPAPAPMQISHSGGGGGGGIYTPLRQLHPYQNRWTLKVRVTGKSTPREYTNKKGTGKLFSFDVLDEAGDSMRVTCFNEQMDKFFELIQVGTVYAISKGSLKSADRRFHSMTSAYEMTADKGTEVTPLADESDIKMESFNFRPIADLENTMDTLVDVIGVITRVDEPITIQTKAGASLAKRLVVLADQSNRSSEVTLWGEQALNFAGHIGAIVALKNAKVQEFRGNKQLSLMNSSTVRLNPDFPEAGALRSWSDMQGGQIRAAPIGGGTGGGSVTEGGRTTQRKTMGQIKDENLGLDKADFFSVRCFITFAKSDANLWYTACPGKDSEGKDCNKKVVEAGDSWTCEKCNKNYPECRYRYVFSVTGADYTGQNWLSFFDDSGAKMLGGIGAEQMNAWKKSNDPQFERTFQSMVFKQFVVKIRAKTETFKDEKRVKYNVMDVSPPDYISESKALIASIKEYQKM